MHLNKSRQRPGKKHRLLLYITENHCNKFEGCLGFRFDFLEVLEICDLTKLSKFAPNRLMYCSLVCTVSLVQITISTRKFVGWVLFLLFFLFLSFSLLDIHHLILTCRYLSLLVIDL